MKTLEDYVKMVKDCEREVEEDKKKGGKLKFLMDRDLIPYHKTQLRNSSQGS